MKIFQQGKHLPTVDVIFPFHRVDRFLYIAIKSILKSTGVKVRLILIDDRKSSKELLDLSRYQIISNHSVDVVMVSAGGNGYSNAINAAKPFIQSEYVGLMNSDDKVSRKRFFRAIKKIEQVEADICIGSLRKFKGILTLPSLNGGNSISDYTPEFLMLGPYGADATLVARSSFWKDSVDYIEFEGPSDWVTAMNVFPQARITREGRSKYFYRIHSAQTTAEVNAAYADALNKQLVRFAEANSIPIPPHDLLPAVAYSWISADLSKVKKGLYEDWEARYLDSLKSNSYKKSARKLLRRKRCLLRVKGLNVKVNFLVFFQMTLEYTLLRITAGVRGA